MDDLERAFAQARYEEFHSSVVLPPWEVWSTYPGVREEDPAAGSKPIRQPDFIPTVEVLPPLPDLENLERVLEVADAG